MALINTQQLVTVRCGFCDLEFGMPQHLYEIRRQDHHSWWCPLGHERHWPAGKTREQQLEEQVRDLAAARDAENQQKLAAQAETRRLRQAQARARRRAAAGVCPCCQRTFVGMARHMKTKHPEYQP